MTAAKAAGSVRIRLSQPTRNLTESRAVLRALQRFGEVVTFRNLKYKQASSSSTNVTDGVILATFDTAESAARAQAASPLVVELSVQRPVQEQKGQTKPLVQPKQLGAESGTTAAAATRTTTAYSHTTTSIVCAIAPCETDHESHIQRHACHEAFNVVRDSTRYDDLVANTGIPVKELADAADLTRRQKVPSRIQQQIYNMNERSGVTSLTGLYLAGLENGGAQTGQQAGVEGANDVGSRETEQAMDSAGLQGWTCKRVGKGLNE